VAPEELEPHVEERLDCCGGDDVGAVQVEEDAADGEHLRAVVAPHRVHALQERRGRQLHQLAQLRHLLADVPVTLLRRVAGGAESH
jgi:hypothetical protein